MIDQSPGRVHPPDELRVLVVVVHPRRHRRHESHGDGALTRINSFRYAGKKGSRRRQELISCSLSQVRCAGLAGTILLWD